MSTRTNVLRACYSQVPEGLSTATLRHIAGDATYLLRIDKKVFSFEPSLANGFSSETTGLAGSGVVAEVCGDEVDDVVEAMPGASSYVYRLGLPRYMLLFSEADISDEEGEKTLETANVSRIEENINQ